MGRRLFDYVSQKVVSSCHKQSAKPPGSNSSPRLRFVLEPRDDEEKLPEENPSVGIILCRKADKSYVDYVLQDYLKPMGVATYKTNLDKLKALLPPEEELKKLIPSSDKDEE